MSLRYRGVLDTVPGRVTVRVRVPSDLLARAERIAEERQVDTAVALGDLVAQELPDALAEAARECLAQHLHPDATMPPASTDGIVPTLTSATVEPHFTRLDHDSVDGPGVDT